MNTTILRNLPNAELWRRLEPRLQQAGLDLECDPLWQDRALECF